MFHIHRCRKEKIEEQIVYHNDAIQNIYEKVNKAVSIMNPSDMNQDSHIRFHTETFTIKMERNHFGLYTIQVPIKGNNYRFIIDTGAQISAIITSSKAMKEGTPKDSITVRSAGGKQQSLSCITIDHFFVGSAEIENHTFACLHEEDFKLRFMKNPIMDFDGLIGWDILSKFDFEMDSKNMKFSKLNLQTYFTYCNLLPHQFPVVIVYDEKKQPAIFGIDSGAKVSWINKDYAKANDLVVEKEATALNFGVHGIEKNKTTLIKECVVSFYRSKFTLTHIRCSQTQVLYDLHLDGIFGNEIFEKSTIQFLNSKGIIRIL